MALLFLSLAGLLILVQARHSQIGFALLVVGVTGLTACAVLPIGTWLLRPLEDRFPQLGITDERADGIILLGGATDVGISHDRGTPTLRARGARIVAFVALSRRFPQAQLVFTGGNANPLAKVGTDAEVTRLIVSQLGLPLQRVIFEQASRNTHENALYARQLVRPRPGQRWLIVTSAADMARAVGCFRAVGWPVIAVPVDYHTKRTSDEWLPGLIGGLEKVDWAAHEWVGLLYYRLRGWTSSLFPAPNS